MVSIKNGTTTDKGFTRLGTVFETPFDYRVELPFTK